MKHKWRLVNSLTEKSVDNRKYISLKALLERNFLTKADIERDVDRVKSHKGIVINNTGIGGKWECRYYKLINHTIEGNHSGKLYRFHKLTREEFNELDEETKSQGRNFVPIEIWKDY